MKPEISVIIPTLGERDTLKSVLKALEALRPVPGSVEALVVDNSLDGRFFASAKQNNLPGFVKVLSCPKPGASSARNKGAAEASGEYLLFLDDDVLPQAGLLEAHLSCVRRNPGALSMGKLLPAESVRNSLFGEFAVYYGLLPGYRELKEGEALSCEHFNSSNFMIRKEDFQSAGGFDEGFDCYGWEDVEFGSRLSASSLRAVFSEKALAVHYIDGTSAAYLKKMKLMGRSAVKFVKKHPALSNRVNILNYDTDKGLFRYNIKEIETLDLAENEALKACRDFADAVERNADSISGLYNFAVIKELLFECYALLLRREYLLGFKEALLGLAAGERKTLVSSLENSEVSKQSSLKEELFALRKVLEHRERHPVRFLFSNLKSRLGVRKKSE